MSIALGLRRLSLLLALLASACAEPKPTPNFVLISIDTLRADHLGAYGYARDTSPNLDAFASRAIRFERAVAPAPWTLPSHVAMLSGHHPHDVGIDDIDSSIPEPLPMLAEQLQAAGYQTAAFVDSAPGGLLGAERGFDRGFDVYAHAPHAPTSGPKYDVALTFAAGLEWLEEREAPFFLFLHTKSVHTAPVEDDRLAESDAPYRSPEPFETRYLPQGKRRFPWRDDRGVRGVKYLRQVNDLLAAGQITPDAFEAERLAELVALYDGGIRYVDDQFGRLMSGLRAAGRLDDTVVIVTADHGEAFLEHYFFLHKEVFSTQTWIPLMILDPRVTDPFVETTPVTLMDVAATILARAGLSSPREGDGRNLIAVGGGQQAERRVFSYSKIHREPFYEGYALEDRRYRLIYHKHRSWDGYRAEFFDRIRDPKEQHPVEDAPELKNAMMKELTRRLGGGRSDAGSTIDLDEQTIESLRALGYVD